MNEKNIKYRNANLLKSMFDILKVVAILLLMAFYPWNLLHHALFVFINNLINYLKKLRTYMTLLCINSSIFTFLCDLLCCVCFKISFAM